MHEKVWLIIINNKVHGPYTIEELKKNRLITPETFAKKVNWRSWLKIKNIPELNEIFKDEENQEEEKKTMIEGKEEAIISGASIDPGHFLLWIFIVILIFLYIFYRLYA